MDYGSAFGAQFREVQERTRDGQPVRVVAATRTYATDCDDLWSALTDAERLPRWFSPVTGKLELGERFQIEGNAGGSILKCAPPRELEISWEFGEHESWVRVVLEADSGKAKMTLEHVMPKDKAAEEHWKQYGPGATGVGWDLAFLGLALHLDSGGQAIDQEKNNAWLASDAGKQFIRDSAECWGKAHVDGGEQPLIAEAMAGQTASFYTGS